MSSSDVVFRTLSEKLVETWGSDIAAGRLAPGDRFSSEDVASHFHVSRGVVREAMRVLETLGMVRLRQRTGISILPANHWSPYDSRVLRWRLAGPDQAELLRSLTELGSAVEPLAAGLAARRATTAECGSLTASVVGMATSSRAGDADAYLTHHIRFHTTVLSAAENPMLERLVPTVDAALRTYTEHRRAAPNGGSEAVRLHGNVAAAIQRRDSGDAAAAMAVVISRSCGAPRRATEHTAGEAMVQNDGHRRQAEADYASGPG